MPNYDAKVHTNDPEQSFIFTLMDCPDEAKAKEDVTNAVKRIDPSLVIREIVIEPSVFKKGGQSS